MAHLRLESVSGKAGHSLGSIGTAVQNGREHFMEQRLQASAAVLGWYFLDGYLGDDRSTAAAPRLPSQLTSTTSTR